VALAGGELLGGVRQPVAEAHAFQVRTARGLRLAPSDPASIRSIAAFSIAETCDINLAVWEMKPTSRMRKSHA